MPTPTPASFVTVAQPFALADGATLLLLIDGPNAPVTPTHTPVAGGDYVPVTFAAKRFANIAAAQAWEVADAINDALTRFAAAGQPPAAVATVNGSNEVVVTNALTLSSNATAGPLLEILPQSSALVALGLTAQIFYPTPWPNYNVPLQL